MPPFSGYSGTGSGSGFIHDSGASGDEDAPPWATPRSSARSAPRPAAAAVAAPPPKTAPGPPAAPAPPDSPSAYSGYSEYSGYSGYSDRSVEPSPQKPAAAAAKAAPWTEPSPQKPAPPRPPRPPEGAPAPLPADAYTDRGYSECSDYESQQLAYEERAINWEEEMLEAQAEAQVRAEEAC